MRLSIAALAILTVAGTAQAAPQAAPTQSGQAAFAAMHEIVEMLKADPRTDWSKVNIDALQRHLADMDSVTLHARVTYTAIPNGSRIRVTGIGEVRNAIRRTAGMHASMAGDTPDYRMTAVTIRDGVELTVVAKSPRGLARVRGLGFFGMLAEGDHHQKHHLMLAKGTM